MRLILIIFLLFISYEISYSQWVQCNNGLTDTTITTFAVNGNTIIVGTYSGHIYFSTDYGDSWIDKTCGLLLSSIRAITISGNTIFLGSYSLLKSTNNGEFWEFIIDMLSKDISSLASNGNMLYAGTYEWGLYVSTDYGVTWDFKGCIHEIQSMSANENNNLILGTKDNGLWNYSYNEKSCIQSESLKYGTILSILAHENEIYLGSFGGGLLISPDNGTSWKNIYKVNEKHNYVLDVAVVNNKIFVGNYDGVFISTNKGDSWKEINEGIAGSPRTVNKLAVCGNYIFAGTNEGYKGSGRGIFRARLDEFTSVDDNNGEEQKLNVFPNPTSTEADISYTTHTAGRAKLVLYNLLGLPVAILADTYMEAGRHSARISTEELPSGAYFITLTTSVGAVTERITVLK